MATSRRSFLKMISLATAGLIIDPKIPVIANNEIYVNKKLGIAFRIPVNWHFYNVQQMSKMLALQVVPPESKELKNHLDELVLDSPLVSIGMLPYDDGPNKQFTPSAILLLEENEGDIELEDGISSCNNLLTSIRKNFNSIEISPITRVAGYRAVKGKFSYTFEADGMKPTPIFGRSCIIELEKYFYTFNMYNYYPEDPYIDELFNQLENSIHIL